MTAPTHPALEPEAPIDIVDRASAELQDATAPLDLGYPGMGYAADERPEQRLQTFDEMLPAARAFYRKP